MFYIYIKQVVEYQKINSCLVSEKLFLWFNIQSIYISNNILHSLLPLLFETNNDYKNVVSLQMVKLRN
jgi:hypothetical protein